MKFSEENAVKYTEFQRDFEKNKIVDEYSKKAVLDEKLKENEEVLENFQNNEDFKNFRSIFEGQNFSLNQKLKEIFSGNFNKEKENISNKRTQKKNEILHVLIKILNIDEDNFMKNSLCFNDEISFLLKNYNNIENFIHGESQFLQLFEFGEIFNSYIKEKKSFFLENNLINIYEENYCENCEEISDIFFELLTKIKYFLDLTEFSNHSLLQNMAILADYVLDFTIKNVKFVQIINSVQFTLEKIFVNILFI